MVVCNSDHSALEIIIVFVFCCEGRWKNRKDIESCTVTVDGKKALKSRKTLKKSTLELLDNALWIWFCQERRTPLSGPIVKEKALILHKKLEVKGEFTASEGWLDRWKTCLLYTSRCV